MSFGDALNYLSQFLPKPKSELQNPEQLGRASGASIGEAVATGQKQSKVLNKPTKLIETKSGYVGVRKSAGKVDLVGSKKALNQFSAKVLPDKAGQALKTAESQVKSYYQGLRDSGEYDANEIDEAEKGELAGLKTQLNDVVKGTIGQSGADNTAKRAGLNKTEINVNNNRTVKTQLGSSPVLQNAFETVRTVGDAASVGLQKEGAGILNTPKVIQQSGEQNTQREAEKIRQRAAQGDRIAQLQLASMNAGQGIYEAQNNLVKGVTNTLGNLAQGLNQRADKEAAQPEVAGRMQRNPIAAGAGNLAGRSIPYIAGEVVTGGGATELLAPRIAQGLAPLVKNPILKKVLSTAAAGSIENSAQELAASPGRQQLETGKVSASQTLKDVGGAALVGGVFGGGLGAVKGGSLAKRANEVKQAGVDGRIRDANLAEESRQAAIEQTQRAEQQRLDNEIQGIQQLGQDVPGSRRKSDILQKRIRTAQSEDDLNQIEKYALESGDENVARNFQAKKTELQTQAKEATREANRLNKDAESYYKRIENAKSENELNALLDEGLDPKYEALGESHLNRLAELEASKRESVKVTDSINQLGEEISSKTRQKQALLLESRRTSNPLEAQSLRNQADDLIAEIDNLKSQKLNLEGTQAPEIKLSEGAIQEFDNQIKKTNSLNDLDEFEKQAKEANLPEDHPVFESIDTQRSNRFDAALTQLEEAKGFKDLDRRYSKIKNDYANRNEDLEIFEVTHERKLNELRDKSTERASEVLNRAKTPEALEKVYKQIQEGYRDQPGSLEAFRTVYKNKLRDFEEIKNQKIANKAKTAEQLQITRAERDTANRLAILTGKKADGRKIGFEDLARLNNAAKNLPENHPLRKKADNFDTTPIERPKSERQTNLELKENLERSYEGTLQDGEMSQLPLRDALERLGFKINKGGKKAKLGNIFIDLEKTSGTTRELSSQLKTKISRALANRDVKEKNISDVLNDTDSSYEGFKEGSESTFEAQRLEGERLVSQTESQNRGGRIQQNQFSQSQGRQSSAQPDSSPAKPRSESSSALSSSEPQKTSIKQENPSQQPKPPSTKVESQLNSSKAPQSNSNIPESRSAGQKRNTSLDPREKNRGVTNRVQGSSNVSPEESARVSAKYFPQSNKESFARVQKEIDEVGFDKAYGDYLNKINSDEFKLNADEGARGIDLARRLRNQGDELKKAGKIKEANEIYDKAADLFDRMAEKATGAGQFNQILATIDTLGSDGLLRKANKIAAGEIRNKLGEAADVLLNKNSLKEIAAEMNKTVNKAIREIDFLDGCP